MLGTSPTGVDSEYYLIRYLSWRSFGESKPRFSTLGALQAVKEVQGPRFRGNGGSHAIASGMCVGEKDAPQAI
eukprot:scaffold1299_cov385-Pavlova_lutheri.AAC.20